MATVHTEFGPGEIIASETVRGRTQHKVAVNGNQIWVDEAKLGITRMADAFAWTPPGHHPDAPSDSFSHLGDEDPHYYNDQRGWNEPNDPSHYAPHDGPEPADFGYGDEAYSGFGDELGGALSPQVHENPGYNKHAPGYDPHRDYTQWEDGRLGWAPVDKDNSVSLPYDPTPQYPAIPGDTESTLQPIHQIDADERLSPADSITFEDREEDEGGNGIGQFTDNFAKAAGNFRDDTWETGQYEEPAPVAHEDEYTTPEEYAGYGGEGGMGPLPGPGQQASPYDYPQYGAGSGNGTDPNAPWNRQGGVEPAGHNVHEAFAFLIPLAEGLMGAGAGAAAGGAAADAGAGMAGQAVARGVGSGAMHMMDGGQGGGGDPVQQAIDATGPGEGWGELQRGAALDSWLNSREQKAAGIGAGLSDRYIDITADVDYHNDPVAQFRHDPSAYISRTGHVLEESVSPEMEHYGQLVEADASIREAAWSDVRTKALRLRREGRVHVKDVAPDRIYASVDGDHGTYDVMIAKEGAFGGFGGGHSISNWRCACEWGRWAFQRRLTYVGRLCSHGYAAYMEMQSSHMKNQPRQRKLTQPPRRKRADALQSVPQRLTPELVINDSEDSHIFLDVEKDERKDTGPDDIVDDKDIVHFARVMTACEQNNWPYPRELVAFLERLGEDQTEEDWKVQDAGSAAGGALNEIRDWADTPAAEDLGHMEERNDDIRDAVDKARDGGTDASALVAFRTAAPSPEDAVNAYTGQPAGTARPGTPGANEYVPGGPRGGPRGPASAEGTPSPNDYVPGGPRGGVGAGQGSSGAPMSVPSGPLNPNNALGTPGAGAPGNGTATGSPITDSLMGAPGASSSGFWGGGGVSGAPSAASGAPMAGGGAAAGPGAVSPTSGPRGGGGAGGTAPGIGDAADQTKGNAIGQGDYRVQSGDTLSDIAQRSGYGGDYNSLAQQNSISDPDHIETGQTINIGKPGGGGGGNAGGGGAPRASDNPATNAPGGPLNQNSGGGGADEASGAAPPPPASNPAQTGSNPATPQNTPQVDTGAIPGGSPGGSGGPTDTSVANQGAGSTTGGTPSVDTPNTSDTGKGGGQGAGNNPSNDTASNIGDVMSGVTDAISSIRGLTGSIFADQGDYDEWQKFAYPEIGPGSHEPFAGSGPRPHLEYSTSEEYADKARKKMDDVTDLGDATVYTSEEGYHPQASVGGGIRRAGSGPRRTVVPEVIREQRPQKGGRQTIASAPEFDDFDPLAPRTASSFEDSAPGDVEAAAVVTAANNRDFVAQFQQTAGADLMRSNGPSQQDNFDIAAAATGFLQKTAGRNYSMAEQAELIREGDIGGAGNLNQLDLRGTHYDESEHSVGLFT